jgi:hypothetical protein
MSDSTRIEELKRRVLLDPASIAFAALAEEYRRHGDFEEAVGTCRAGLQRHPAYLSARVTLGRALLEMGRFDEARDELEHVLRVAPENLAAIRALADIHHRRGEALEHYHPENADPHADPSLPTAVGEPPSPASAAPAAAETAATPALPAVAAPLPVTPPPAAPVPSHPGTPPPAVALAPTALEVPPAAEQGEGTTDAEPPAPAPAVPALRRVIQLSRMTDSQAPADAEPPASVAPADPPESRSEPRPEAALPQSGETPSAAEDREPAARTAVRVAALSPAPDLELSSTIEQERPSFPRAVPVPVRRPTPVPHPDEAALPRLEALLAAIVRARNSSGAAHPDRVRERSVAR